METIKKKAIKGTFWSGIDKLVSDSIQFLVTVIMARILMPEDYGMVGILLVFISFSSIFVDGGLTTALIQKNNRTDLDYYTAFIYNIVVAVLIYIGIFFIAPYIAHFYNKEELIWLIRALSINIVIVGLASVQTVFLTIKLDFKSFFYVSFLSGSISGILGIICAYKDYGVWAIVIQQLSYQGLKTLLLHILSGWHPKLVFSKESFSDLFSFGGKLVLTNLLAKIYENLYPLVIGKMYPMKILGYYSRAQQFSSLPVSLLTQVIMRVSFPVMSSIKGDNNRLRDVYITYITLSSFLIFPIMFLLIVIAQPLIILVLTEKWLNTVPFLQLLCLGAMFNHISSINLNLLFVKGRSDLALKLEILKKTIAITIFMISTLWGIWGVCIGQTVYGFIAILLNSKYTYQLVGISYYDQFKEYSLSWFIAAISCASPFLVMKMCHGAWNQMLAGVTSYSLTFLMINYMLSSPGFSYAIDALKTISPCKKCKQ